MNKLTSRTVQEAAPSARRDAALLDELSFRQAIDDHSAAVYRYAVAHVGPQHAEDVVSETFIAAWRSRDRFVDPSNNGLEAWLIGIARNIVASHRRKESRWLRMCADALHQRADASNVTDELEAVERVDSSSLVRLAKVTELLGKLPARERDPLLLHVLHGRTYSEISEMLDLPLGTVQSRISRGRARLAKSIRAAGGRR